MEQLHVGRVGIPLTNTLQLEHPFHLHRSEKVYPHHHKCIYGGDNDVMEST